MDGFQEVRRKSYAKKRNRKSQTTMSSRLQEIRLNMISSEFFKETIAILKNCVGKMESISEERDSECPDSQPSAELVCYGLGNFADSYIARYQLSFFMALREELQVPAVRCSLYDPQFTVEEIEFLKQIEMTVLDFNEEGKRPCEEGHNVIFYMPHCGKALYNNLLWSNWGKSLYNVVVIGNSFTRMVESTPARILAKTANYVLKIQPYITEHPLPCGTQYEDVFNDTSIHTLDCSNAETVPINLWEDNQEPVYDDEDAEIIFR